MVLESIQLMYKHLLQHNTIEAVLQRGEKIDDLVEKSEGLSIQSKTFYKTVRFSFLSFV